MLPLAKGDILIFTDADVRLTPTALDAILSPFEDSTVGMVTCPYRAVSGRSLRERLDVLPTNTIFLPSIALAERLEGVRFAFGACIAIRREVLEEIGGLDSLVELLPDDYALAKGVRSANYRVALAPILLDHCVSSSEWRAMAGRHLRWARTIQCVRPCAYFLTILTHGLPPALALGLTGNGLGLALLSSWAAARLLSTGFFRRRLGLSVADLLLVPVSDIWAFLIYLGSLLKLPVWWDDRQLVLGPGGVIVTVNGTGSQRVHRRRAKVPQGAPHPSG